MKVFRGTRDILPQDLNHRRLTPAVYGIATYFAINESDGFHYALGGFGDCQVVTTYNLPINKIITITDQDWWNIGSLSDPKKPLQISTKIQELLEYQNHELVPVNLSKVTAQSGFEAAILTGVIEGGEQVVVPENEVTPEVISYHVKLAKSFCGRSTNQNSVKSFRQVLEDNHVLVQESQYYLEFTLTPNQLRILNPVLEFLKITKDRNCFSIDFHSLTIEPYPDEY